MLTWKANTLARRASCLLQLRKLQWDARGLMSLKPPFLSGKYHLWDIPVFGSQNMIWSEKRWIAVGLCSWEIPFAEVRPIHHMVSLVRVSAGPVSVYFHSWANGIDVLILTVTSAGEVWFVLKHSSSPSIAYCFSSLVQRARKRNQDLNSKLKDLTENKSILIKG